MKRKWFITGISGGLGKAIASAAMSNGDFVIGTFRSKREADAFNDRFPGRAFALTMDLRRSREVEDAFRIVNDNFGTIDVLVNNAGYGLAGAIEETSMEEARDLFDVNVFAALAVTQSFIPMFRAQRSGHIIQVSSHGGVKASAGFGIYNASKFALEGLSEALAEELLPLGVKLTIVEPGPIRTNFAGSSLRMTKNHIDDYDVTAGSFKRKIGLIDGKQESDPAKMADAIVKIAGDRNAPLRLILGKTALTSMENKIRSLQKSLDDSATTAGSVGFGDI